MKTRGISSSVLIYLCSAIIGISLFSGCATTENIYVVEQPDKEAMWGEWVKENYPLWKQHYWIDKDLWGNRGYIVGGPPPLPEEKLASMKKERKILIDERIELPQITIIEETEKQDPLTLASEEYVPEKPKSTYYTVKKGDCLWYIAGYKDIYGDPLQWPVIYKANRDKITKDPDLIYPGQVFVIPRD